MRYPKQRCSECGHRLYAHIDGGTFCPACGYYFAADDDGGAADEPATPQADY
jgi:uncharacterized Zn finger protein (UPF0148 family)